MKKTLLVLAAGAVFAGAAGAASVSVYGTVDTGLSYLQEKTTNEARSRSFAMGSGLSTDSLLGITGEEDLRNGTTVSFRLEHTFNSDSGEFGSEGTLFDKEAMLTVSGSFGSVSVGRMGALTSGSGTYNIFTANADAMDGGYADVIGTGYWMARDVYNNMLAYAAPEIGGFTAYAQYGFGNEDDAPHSRGKDRYAAIGAVYANGPLTLTLSVDTVLKNRTVGSRYLADLDDAMAVSFGGSWDFGFMKTFAAAQFGKHENALAGHEAESGTGDYDGHALHLGAAFPVWGGELQVSGYYADGDGHDYEVGASGTTEGGKRDVSMWGVAAMHSYELSKRTSLYFGAGYQEKESQLEAQAREKTKSLQGVIGMAHSF